MFNYKVYSYVVTSKKVRNILIQRKFVEPLASLRLCRQGLASHAGVFRGARISSLPTNACSTEDNIPFPLLHSRGK